MGGGENRIFSDSIHNCIRRSAFGSIADHPYESDTHCGGNIVTVLAA
jgi:hypothetical protein